MDFVSRGVQKEKEHTLTREINELRKKLVLQEQASSARIAELEQRVHVLTRMAFGRSSERRKPTGNLDSNPNQQHLFLTDILADAERVAEETGAVGHLSVTPAAPSKAKNKGRRSSFPDHLPVVAVEFELPEDERRCSCGGELHKVGFEQSQELERIEVTILLQKKRAKYACRSCGDGITTATGPARVIDKGLLGVGFLANIITERFVSHMPYYRLEKKYQSEGLDLSRSVLERSVARCAELLEPLHAALREEVLSKDILFTDDTTVTLVNPRSKGGSSKGRVWIYLDKLGNHFYDFTKTREASGPELILKDFLGYVHADAYGGYDWLFQPGGPTEVACWAHTRRYFERAEKSDPKLSAKALDLIRGLYRIEKKAKEDELNPEAVAALRQEYAVPILKNIWAWLAEVEAQVLPKGPMGKAVHYAQAHWDALNVYVTDGRLEIDNNASERAMRPIAVGRKNWLFFQTIGGGKTAAILMSLIQTAKAAGVNVQLYLRDVLQRIATESDMKKLLPHAWKEHFEPEVMKRRNEIVELLGSK
ncbi:MAG: transposase [Candidatus Paceibacteria bacterium]|jgi:transposase